MAIFKVVPFKNNIPQTHLDYQRIIYQKINYIFRPDAAKQLLFGGFNVLLSTPEQIADLFCIPSLWHNRSGHIPIQHIVLSLDPYSFIEDRVSPKDLATVIDRFCLHEFGDDYQVVYAIHEDALNLHAHILINTVNLNNGKLLPWRQEDHRNLCEFMDFLLRLTIYRDTKYPMRKLPLVYS